jgi:hypothetical protein
MNHRQKVTPLPIARNFACRRATQSFSEALEQNSNKNEDQKILLARIALFGEEIVRQAGASSVPPPEK